jgi:hypothetical protein
MKKIIISSICLLWTYILVAQSVTIGTGTTASYFYGPYYRSSATSTFNYSKYAYIYTADELTGIPSGSIITSIEWEKSAGTLSAPNTFQIYLENNAATTLTANTTWGTLIAAGTSVYSNTNQGFTATAPGWEGFTLTAPFIYTGGTLQICTDHIKAGTASGANNYFYTNVPGKAIGWAAGAAGSDATNLGGASYSNNRPNIRINYIPGTNCSGTPEAGTSTSSSTAVCPTSSFALSLSGATLASGLTYQWQSSIDGITYTDIPNATLSSFSTSQTADTYYQCIVTCTGSGSQDISTPVLVSTNSFVNCYCSSNATSTADEEILNVSIGTLNNSSSCTTTGSTGSILNQYSDYTTTVTPPILVASANYTLGIQLGTCGGNFGNMTKAYIDFNQNGQFTDAGEEVYASASSSTGPNNITASILVPSNALTGLTRMRIVNVETTSAANVNPCGTYTWGETEDYLVNIVPPPTCPQPTNLSLATSDLTSATIQWIAGGTETQWQIEYGPQGFTPGTGTFLLTTTNPTTITGLTSYSFYQAYVRGICTPGDSSYWAGTISWNTYDQGQYMDWNSACPTEGFIDITSSGTLINTTDDSEFGITLPFPVLYQGSLFTNCTIGNNGGIIFGTTTGGVGYNMVAGNGLYPFVQDLNTALTGGGVYHAVLGNAPNRKFVVSWIDLPHFGTGGTDGSTFQLIIEEATMEIYFVYDDVQMSNTAWNYGADAEIGVRGTNQNIDVSLNNASYLQNNSCVHFSYTDCPKPKDFTTTFVGPTDVNFTWTPSIANETSWTIIYGPDGFDPATGGTTATTTTPSLFINNLTQLTQYDVYIYADCSIGIQSEGLLGTFLTPPFCSNPVGLTATSAPDSILTTWNWTLTSTQYPITGFNIQYGPLGFELYTAGTTIQVDNNFNDTLQNSALLAGGVYQVYVQAVCGADTSQFVGPITVTMPLTNDDICGAETLPVDGTNYVFNNTGATINPNDASIAPPATGANTTDGWINSTLNLTTWFKFIAPNSGDIRINCNNINYNGQVAVYNNTTCQAVNLNNLIAANDNEIGGTSLAPNFTVCGLTPGNTYFLLFDGFNSTTGNYAISLSEIVLEAGTQGSQLDVCYGDTVNLFDGISGNDQGGVWTQQIPTLGLQDSLFVTSGLASIIFNFTYTMSDGCASDEVNATVKVFSPSNAGNDGILTVCRNEPFNLLSGLSGNLDLGGIWYNPSNQALSGNLDTASNIPGQFNYNYVVGNGICPEDTATVLVSVSNLCNFIGIDENDLTNIKLFPNPTKDKLTISVDGETEPLTLIVEDLNGRVIDNYRNLISGKGSYEIDLTNYDTGIYIIRLENSKTKQSHRIIKQ